MDKKLLPILIIGILFAAFLACGEAEESQAEETEQTAEQVEEEVEEVIEEEETEVVDPEMTEEEMVAWVMENCICPQCPSWIPEAAEKGEGGYCAVGVSECIVDEVGCICPDCPVTEEKGLEWGYYCTRGSAEELSQQ